MTKRAGQERLLRSAQIYYFLGGYLLSGCNLWTATLAHGLSDTFAVVAVFIGASNQEGASNPAAGDSH